MKRDWDLIRALMLTIETEDKDEEARLDVEIAKFPEQVRNEHLALLIEAGFLQGAVQRVSDNQIGRVHVSRITWAGHDFLSAIHNDKIWKRVTGAVRDTAGAVTLDVLKELLQQGLKTMISVAPELLR